MSVSTNRAKEREPGQSKFATVPTAHLLLLSAAVILAAGGFLISAQISPASRWVGDGPCVLYFYADWCTVCQQMAPIVDELEQQHRSDLRVVRVDTSRRYGQQLAREYGFIGQPTFIFLDRSGQESSRLIGIHTVETIEREIARTLARSTE